MILFTKLFNSVLGFYKVSVKSIGVRNINFENSAASYLIIVAGVVAHMAIVTKLYAAVSAAEVIFVLVTAENTPYVASLKSSTEKTEVNYIAGNILKVVAAEICLVFM